MESHIDSIRSHALRGDEVVDPSLHLFPNYLHVPIKEQKATGSGYLGRDLSDPLLLHLDQYEVQILTQLIANEHLTLDECVWILAETSLSLDPALDLPQNKLWWGRLPETVKLLPSYMYRIPQMEEVRYYAHKIAEITPAPDDVQLYLAQRLYIAHQIFKE